MTVTLGGTERSLNFKMGAKDELQRMLAERTGPEWQTEGGYLAMIIEAGLICNERIKQGIKWGEEPVLSFTPGDIRQWVYEMENDQQKVIVDFFNQAYGLVSKEANADTQ